MVFIMYLIIVDATLSTFKKNLSTESRAMRRSVPTKEGVQITTLKHKDERQY